MWCNGGPAPVGTYLNDLSVYGVYDMAGNISEWVEDYFSEDFYAQSPVDQPVNKTPGPYNHRVIRGASAFNSGDPGKRARVTYRMLDSSYNPYTGFRCAISVGIIGENNANIED
jgi:formylglycine-generating enzyme required for sulfatase activity